MFLYSLNPNPLGRKGKKMLFEIKNRFSGEVIFKLETESLRLCVEAAIKSRADLSGANLYGANLSRADLYGANLSRANLYGAKNMVKTMGVEIGNYYWKRFEEGLNNNGYQFKGGINKLRDKEVF